MVDVLLFHHALGLTPGVVAFADVLRGAGYRVHVPDLYNGRTFDDLGAGIGYAQRVGLGAIVERGVRAAAALPDALIYAGFSLGVLPAQTLAQKRRGARGALLFSACVPTGQIGGAWPRDVPVQVHGMAGDTIFVGEGDLEAARGLVSNVEDGELFLYAGRGHLFADAATASYDPGAAGLLTDRVVHFLERVA